ncbi:MAG: CpXC domain-containing protein [Caldilineales bacterium]|nr:CpXC domain-containing protein [Caldilineales bacterium]
MFRPQAVSLRCPRCGFTYQTPVFTIIDVGQTPELKQLVLSGGLNASQCPHCGNINAIVAPLLYHDPAHEFLGVFIPPQLNLNEAQRQKIIGDLSNALMNSIPAEQRRFYMLNPQQFLTMDSLIEKLLGFEGITPEMLAASRKKLDLVQDLVRVRNDTIAFNIVVKENEKFLDREFFGLLTQFMMAAQAEGNREQAMALADVREKLLPLTEYGRRILKQRQAVQNLGERPTRERVLQAILQGDMDEAEAIAVVARPILDYRFFQELTNRIEALPAEERAAQEQKRQHILEVLETLRAADQAALQMAQQVLQELLTAEDLDKAIAEMLPYIDQTVLTLLLANIEEAERRGATAAVKRLTDVWERVTAALKAAIPPEVQLLYALTEADYPDGTRQILRDNKALVTPQFLEFLEQSIKALEEEPGEDGERRETIRHLKNVLTQARLGV